MPEDEWRETVAKTAAGEAWIIDGNYSGTMEIRLKKCDTAIFLGLPRHVCVYRVLKRVVTYRKGKRPDMADGCDEKFDWEFIKWVWNYPKRSKPKVEKLLNQYQNTKTVIRLKSENDIENFLLKQ